MNVTICESEMGCEMKIEVRECTLCEWKMILPGMVLYLQDTTARQSFWGAKQRYHTNDRSGMVVVMVDDCMGFRLTNLLNTETYCSFG